MQKALIISYFFPPCNFVGAERTNYWADNLYKHGIYPIIITRCWNENQKDIVGIVKGNLNKKVQNNYREIHYLKYKPQLRDFLKNIKLLRKALTLIQQLFFYILPKSLNYYNFYTKSFELLKNDNEIKTVIISGRPFESFYIGYKLKKKFPHINWIPDYRDQWNTYQDRSSSSIISKCFSLIEKRLEKKWTSNCTFFISTTPNWTDRISEFINKKGKTILNGFDGELIKKNSEINSNKLKIVYAGTLYPNQKIENFLNVISQINSKHNKISIEFIGCEMIEGQIERLHLLKLKHKGDFIITERLIKKDLNDKLLSADLFYLTAFENVKGWYPVKLFEYSKFPNPIIFYPSDKDIIDDFIKSTNTGYTLYNSKEVMMKLLELIEIKSSNQKIYFKKNVERLNFFSRSFQTAKLAEILIN